MDRKIILITGASSGLGLATANHLASAGHIVYAAARSFGAGKSIDSHNPHLPNESQGQHEPHGSQSPQAPAQVSGHVEKISGPLRNSNLSLHKVYLDVTDNASIDKTIQRILQKEKKIDVLINCAAQIILGAVEDTSAQEYRQVLETNFIGTLNMCKAVLPSMRSCKHGVIINFSSINGILGIPFQSAYVASKFAIEGLSECLSMEVAKYGIKIVLIEPGDHRSGSGLYRTHAGKADEPTSPYSEAFRIGTLKIAQDEANGSDPAGVARLISAIITKKNPRLRYTIGRFDQRFASVLKKYIPGRMFEMIIGDYYKK